MKIKVNFYDFWTKDLDKIFLYRILCDYFDIEISSQPDYVFFSCFGSDHLFVPDNCIKVFYTGENIVPDFNLCDYAIGFEYMSYGDRYLRYQDYDVRLETKHILPNDFSLDKDKPNFCSFVVSNGNGDELRTKFFNLLSKYKKVDSGGKYLNNIGGPVADKFLFESTHKFSICFENSSHPGYTTEKLPEAFAARTIPIYWGDPRVGDYFNTDAMINIHDYQSIEQVVSRVREIDQCPDEYLRILQTPALQNPQFSHFCQKKLLVDFLSSIFSQNILDAQRRNRTLRGLDYVTTSRLHAKYERRSIQQELLYRAKCWWKLKFEKQN